MKILFWLALLPFVASAEPASTHGMVLLGKQSLYLSHLPMFHAPHDWQVIFSVEIDAASRARLAAAPGDFFTLVPEKFALGEMIASPHAFEAEIYGGHFERGGELLASHVKVSNVKVVFAQKLVAKVSGATQSQYLVFGSEEEQWMAHVIQGKPSFDQILSVAGSVPFTRIAAFPLNDDSEPMAAGISVEDATGAKWKIKKSVHLEFDDLAH